MSLYPISTACPKCGAKPHTVCSNILSHPCDERWIAAGAHVIDSPTTNPETAGVEPVALTEREVEAGRRARIFAKSPFCTIEDHDEIMIVLDALERFSHPAPASNTTSEGEGAALKAALLHCLQVLDLAAGDGLHYRAGGETFDAGDAVFELAKALGVDIANVGDVPGRVIFLAALLGQTATPIAAIRSGSE